MSFGAALSYYNTFATMIVPLPQQIPISIGVMAFIVGLTGFLSTYLPFVILAITGLETITATIPIMLAVLVAGTVLTVVYGLRERHYFENM